MEIERAANKDKRAKMNIWTSRPGIVIGRKGVEVENLKKELQKLTDKEILLNITEVKRPEVDAQLVSENVALQLERRVSFRRAMKRNVSQAMKFGAKGIKIMCSGRLAGAEMARTEWYREGTRASSDHQGRHRIRHRDGKDQVWRHRRQSVAV